MAKAKKGQKNTKVKLTKKIQEHNKNEFEKYQKLFNPQAYKKETTEEPETLTLAEIIQQKRIKKKQQHKMFIDLPKKDIWNNIEALERKVDYDLSLLTSTKQMEKPQVDEEIWKQFTSFDFVQSMEEFLNNTMYDVQGLLKKLSVK